ncbi:MAG: pyridoxamine 5'-phosphate oxidase family protein [Alphaproteobacteria bacterium]|nr:pyridoxamine 5'-phosphate oxidase family protein [Alphaproteobacteria bacterium]
MNTKILERADGIIKTCTCASFGVIDENGYPSVSTISLVRPESISELYFTTTIDSNKAKRLQKINKASICCRAGEDANITLVGETEILDDQESKSKYWLDWFSQIYEGGETDPAYCVIKFTARRASLWIDDESSEFEIA